MESKIKELIKLCDQLEKLIIRIISLVGWIMNITLDEIYEPDPKAE